MKKLVMLVALLSALLVVGQDEKLPTEPGKSVFGGPAINTKSGQIFLRGKLGNLGRGYDAVSMLENLTAPFRSTENQSFVEVGSEIDELNHIHFRMQQYINGLAVVGSDVIVHADNKTGEVYAINGNLANGDSVALEPSVDGARAIQRGMRMANIVKGSLKAEPELTYILSTEGETFLAWTTEVTYTNAQGPQRDILFVDATGAEKVVRHPQHHYARNRRTHSANNGSSLPGTLRRTEGQGKVNDAAVDAAHDNAGLTYDYYKAVFNRDSYNGAGATMTSSAHYQRNLNNAYWNGSQMIYGDGDGQQFSYLSGDLDVVAHELTHAVTSNESNLVYQNEPGALNEALSDIFGVSTVAWYEGGINSLTWVLGDKVYTPGTPNDGLRYMNDPARGQQPDYYPDRYTGSNDNGGVHINSGIANLAFYLMVSGGTHPRGKTTVSVPAIGLDKAQRIFYRAQTTYLTSNSNFNAMRNATASAATDLYDAATVAAVHLAWDAVGAPGSGGGGGGGGGGTCTGTVYNGYVNAGAKVYQPNNTYYYSNAGTHKGHLEGPAGTDFDLYLYQWNGYQWSQVAVSGSSTSVEDINYNGATGYYIWEVHAYAGSGSYVFCLSRP